MKRFESFVYIIEVLFGLMIIFSIYFKSNKDRSDKISKTKMKKLLSLLILIIGIIVLAIGVFSYTKNIFYKSTNNDNSDNTVSKADGFNINSFDVYLDVKDNGVIDVTERIGVYFYESGHHGIYRFIPEWYEYTNKNNETKSRKSIISNLEAVGDNYTVDVVKDKKRIKIGDANYTLTTGTKTYVIKYEYDMGIDPYEGFDEFIFHAYGDYWGTKINNATMTIKMPKEIDQNSIKFFADKYRKNDITSKITYNVLGNTIKVEANDSLLKSLTVDIDLPEGYFVNGNDNYGKNSLILCFIIIFLTIISFLLWFFFGKDYKNGIETVEFYPPENLDPSEVGYIYKNDGGRKLTISLIVSLASKGYLKINESDDHVISIINLYPKNTNRSITIKKVSDCDNSITVSQADKDYLNELFKSNNELTIKGKEIDDFFNKGKLLVDFGYIEVVDDINVKDNNDFAGKNKMTENEKLVYDQLFNNSDNTMLITNTEFYKVFNKIDENLIDKYDTQVNENRANNLELLTSIMFLVSSFLLKNAFTVIEDLNPKYFVIYIIALISCIIILILSLLMPRKSKYGENIKAQINGFKNYLVTAEKDQLIAQVEKNPSYFYDILPYAYVLGITSLWIEKFEKIPIPYSNVDIGNYNYNSSNSFDNMLDSVYYPTASSSGSSCGGGCSSCGGGCSSCGGGCSSCGGGGSW